LGGSAALPYATVLAVYMAAAVAGMLAHAPGGIGVVEAVTLAALPGAETIAGLLAFRAIYYLVPLALGGAALACFELFAVRRKAARTAARAPCWCAVAARPATSSRDPHLRLTRER
jgi:uncharacterized membrane protein YbhN (UPF0104 family)